MAYTDERGGKIRVRWRIAAGKYSGGITIDPATGKPWASHEAAKRYGADQEAAIRLGLITARTRITFGDWSRTWYSGLDLEPSTMVTYRSLLRSHLLPRWEQRWLDEIEAHEMDPWEREMISVGYRPSTARDARRLMTTILADAVPRYIDRNPAAKRRGKGRKGQRRIQEHQQAAKVWASPLEALLVAERAALLAHDPDMFVGLVSLAWTGLRWSELCALRPVSVLGDGMLNIDTKLYQLGAFYLGYPKDGSLRHLVVPQFLEGLLAELAGRARSCSCEGRSGSAPAMPEGSGTTQWCEGGRYLILTPRGAHYDRGAMSSRIMRPACDGWYPARRDRQWTRPRRPVLADVARYGAAPAHGRPAPLAGEQVWPGAPARWPWPPAIPGEEFVPPRGRGRPDWPRWPEAQRPYLVSWLPVRPGLTPHGLRHSYQTWMDAAGIAKALKVEQMGHVDATMQGRYGHITEGMVQQLRDAGQAWWENAVRERFQISPSSPVPVLDRELARWRDGTATSTLAALRPRQDRMPRPRRAAAGQDRLSQISPR